MSIITNIAASDLITNSRAVVNNNFSALNTDKMETSFLDTDSTLAANSDLKVATQKAVKAYIDAGGASGFPTSYVTTSTGATDAGKGVKLNANGLLDESFISTDFGDGSDGTVTISSPTTLTRDMYYDSLTVTSTLTTDGYRTFVKGTLSGSGTITWGTANAGTGGSANTGGAGAGGAGGAQGGSGYLKNTAGGAGGMGGQATDSGSVAGTAGADGYIGSAGSAGGAGADGSSGAGAAGAGGANSSKQKFGIEKWGVLSFTELVSTGLVKRTIAGSGGGGGGGAGNNDGEDAGGGGGGGATGGIVFIVASNWAGTFTISNVGAAAGSGGATTDTDAGGGGGGAGGQGGINIIIYRLKSWAGSHVLTGGAGGAGGAKSGGGAGSAGSSGAAGATGVSYELELGRLV